MKDPLRLAASRLTFVWLLAALFVFSAPPAPAAAATRELVRFGAGEFPEGLSVAADGTIYAGILSTGEIVRVTPSGQRSRFAELPLAEGEFMVGLVVDSAGSVYALAAAQDETNGVWWVSRDGSTVVQFARLPAGAFPNDLVIDTAGRIYVTDTVGGRIFRLTGNDGAAEVWAESPLLLGNVEDPGPLGMPIGANGIALAPGGQALYVAVSEQESIVRIPIQANGSAGAVSVVAEDDDLAGVDGIDVGPDGLIYAAVNEQNQIATVNPETGRVAVVASGSQFHFPAVLRFSPDGSRYYVTNFDAPVLFGLAPGPAQTGLLVVDTAPGTGIAPPRTGDGSLAE